MANEIANNKHMKNLNNNKGKNSLFLKLFGGLVVGVTNGFFGGGGGMVLVPLMTLFMRVEEKKAHATAISIILPLSIASSIFYITIENFELNTLLFVMAGVFVGGILGATLLKKLSNKIIGLMFAVIMILAGMRLIV